MSEQSVIVDWKAYETYFLEHGRGWFHTPAANPNPVLIAIQADEAAILCGWIDDDDLSVQAWIPSRFVTILDNKG